MAITSGVSLLALVFRELRRTRPIVDFRLFARRNFALANVQMFVLGFVLYGAVVLLPQFMQDLMGYSATDAGMVLSPGGLAMVAMMPVAGALAARVDSRWLIGAGFLAAALACYHTTLLNLQLNFHTLELVRVYQAGALAFLFIPINMAAFAGVPQGRNDDVSALINFARNLGGSTGIAILSTVVTRRQQIHQRTLIMHTTGYDTTAASTARWFAQLLGRRGAGFAGANQSYARLYQGVRAQAATLAYGDAFAVMALICAGMVALVFMMKRCAPARGIVIG